MGTKRKRGKKEERKKERRKRKMKESEKKRESKEKLLISYFLWTRKGNRVPNVLEIPKSNMWLEQSRFKVTFMHKTSRM